jgi:hypothetical protein
VVDAVELYHKYLPVSTSGPQLNITDEALLQVSAEPWFGAKPVEKICHDTEPGEGKNNGSRTYKACENKPIGTVKSGQQGTERKIHPDKEIDVPFKKPLIGLHEIECAASLFPQAGRFLQHRFHSKQVENITYRAETGECNNDGAAADD